MRLRGALAVLIAGLLLPLVAGAGDWKLRVTTDAMTDQERRMAAATNADGHRLSVYRIKSGEVWMNFSVSDRSLDLISPDKLISYRIDKREPTHLQEHTRMARLGIVTYEWEPKWVNFLLWHGKENEGRGEIQHLMDGSSMLVRYYLSTGGYKDAIFSLDGAGPVIADALGIKVGADGALEENAEKSRALLRAHIVERCQPLSGRAALLCRTDAVDCNSLHKNDPPRLGACLAAIPLSR